MTADQWATAIAVIVTAALTIIALVWMHDRDKRPRDWC
jgi:hypothetical protein